MFSEYTWILFEAEGVEVAIKVAHVEYPVRDSCSSPEKCIATGIIIAEEGFTRCSAEYVKLGALLDYYHPWHRCNRRKHRPIHQATLPDECASSGIERPHTACAVITADIC